MANEYFAIILEVSPRVLNVGFAGESSPQVSLHPDLTLCKKYLTKQRGCIYPRYLDLHSHSLTPEQKLSLEDALQNDSRKLNLLEKYKQDYCRRFVNWNQDDYRTLARLIKYIVTRILLVSPAQAKIFVLDQGLPGMEKFHLTKALVEATSCARSVYFIPRIPCVSMAANVEDSLVIDFQWQECRVIALQELRIVKEAAVVEYSEETVCYRLVEEGVVDDADEALSILDEKSCSIFEGLSAWIARFVHFLAVDVRPKVVQNVVFCGDLVKSVELQRQLVKDIQNALPNLRVSGKHCLGAWTGASIYCSTTLLRHDMNELRHSEVTKEKLHTGHWKDILLS